MRSGLTGIYSGNMRYVGSIGYAWSSMATSKHDDGTKLPSANNLGFALDGANSSSGPNARWFAFPLRRLGSGGDKYTTGSLGHMMN